MHELPQIQEMFDDVVHELIVALAARGTATKEVKRSNSAVSVLAFLSPDRALRIRMHRNIRGVPGDPVSPA
jgi:hypothetical protein